MGSISLRDSFAAKKRGYGQSKGRYSVTQSQVTVHVVGPLECLYLPRLEVKRSETSQERTKAES